MPHAVYFAIPAKSGRANDEWNKVAAYHGGKALPVSTVKAEINRHFPDYAGGTFLGYEFPKENQMLNMRKWSQTSANVTPSITIMNVRPPSR